MIKGKLPPVQEDSYLQFDENEEAKYQKFLSPLPKNRYESTNGKKLPRRSTLGIPNFNPNAETSPGGDRYIPRRRGQDSNIAMYEINHEDSPPLNIDRDNFDNSWEYEECKAEYTQKLEYEGVLKEAFFGTNSPEKENGEDYVDANILSSPQKAETKSNHPYKKKLLNFKTSKNNKENLQRGVRNKTLRLNDFRGHNMTAKPIEKITKIYPERVLDAPNMVDDFYLNLLDWSDQNVIAIGLENWAYLMDVTSNSITGIKPNSRNNLITSLSWMNMRKDTLAIGLENGDIEIWDTNLVKRIRTLQGHVQRVSSLSWNNNILSTGSLDSSILNHDIRDKNHIIERFQYHTKEVWGLKWSFDGTQLASGSNDNTLCIWDINSHREPKHTFTSHRAAVKALAWSPLDKNLLASGGGTKDKSIKFWDTEEGTEICSLKTSAQICSLIWSKNSKEIISSHGYEKNELFVWKYLPHKPEMPVVKTAELSGHDSRVLHLAISPNGTTVASTAPDETLRFWKVFQSDEDCSLYSAYHNGNSLFRDVIR